MRTPATGAFVNQMVVATLFGIGVGGSVGVASVWMRHQISVAAEANKAIEMRLANIERLSQQTKTWIAEEQDVSALLRKNAEMHLGLVPGQVVQVAGDPVRNLVSKEDAGLLRDRAGAQRSDGSISFSVALQP
jgi:hypothetical protein